MIREYPYLPVLIAGICLVCVGCAPVHYHETVKYDGNCVERRGTLVAVVVPLFSRTQKDYAALRLARESRPRSSTNRFVQNLVRELERKTCQQQELSRLQAWRKECAAAGATEAVLGLLDERIEQLQKRLDRPPQLNF